ncbi:MAG: nodulation protein NfeD [Phycisphaerales bacterium]
MQRCASQRNLWTGRCTLGAATGLSLLVELNAAWAIAAQPTAPGPPNRTAVPAYRQSDTVAVLTIRGAIDRITLHSLERRLSEALRDGADAIVLDIDTPGGALVATLNICHLIKTDAPANTVAWINPMAYSAGTIIALACREIVTAPDASFGDAAPISPFGVIAGTERAKIESPILTEVVDSARRNHYDENLVQAFVGVGVELWLIEHVNTGEKIFVDRQEYHTVFGREPPQELTPVASPSGLDTIPVRPWFNTLIPQYDDAGEAPIDPQQRKAEMEFQQQLPPARAPLAETDRGKWRLIAQVVSDDRLLTLKPAEGIYYGLATAVISGDEQLKAYFGARTLRRYDRTWSESLVQFLTDPIVMGVLIVIFLVCFLIELAAPGVGAFGAAAGISLLVLIGAPWLAGMAQWWEVLLIAAGLLLIAVELFVIPGFGVAGVTGAVCLLGGLVGTFVSGDLGTPAGQSELLTGLTAMLTALFAAGIAFWLVSRQLETVPILSRFVLKTQVGQPEGHNGEPGLLEAIGDVGRPLESGDLGTADTDLRPAGRAMFNGRLVDVKSVGDYIDRGTPLRVVSVGRFVIEVEESK